MRGICHFFTILVAMATSFDILEKEVQIDHLHPKGFNLVKRCDNQSSGSLFSEQSLKRDKKRKKKEIT